MNLWNVSSLRYGIGRNPVVAILILGSLIGTAIVELSPSPATRLFFSNPSQSNTINF